MKLEQVLQRRDIWRGAEHRLRRPHPSAPAVLSTGLPELDAQLGDQGWPPGALVEVLLDQRGIGELQLWLPALGVLSRAGLTVWVNPPHVPYPPALGAQGIRLASMIVVRTEAELGWWALEQALRSGACTAALAWLPEHEPVKGRRIQLAAESSRALAIVFRSLAEARRPSPAAMRLRLRPQPRATRIEVFKRRGGWHTRPVLLPRPGAVAPAESY